MPPEPTATERAIAEGTRTSEPQGAENLLAEFRAIQAEMGGPEDEETEAAQLAQIPTGDDKAEKKDGPGVAKTKPKPDGEPKKGTEGRLTVKERAELREEKRAYKAGLAAREQAIAQREQQLLQSEAGTAEMLRARQLYEAGDFDGAAKAAFGVVSWNDMNDRAARAFASPEYRHSKALADKVAQLEAEREERRRGEMTFAQQQREQQILSTFHKGLTESLPQAEDETIAALAETDPAFVDAVFNRIVAAARQGEDLDPIEVAEELVETARTHYERVHKVFGGRPTSQAEMAQAIPPNRAGSTKPPVKPQRHVSRTAATEVSAPPDFENDAEWVAFGAKALRRAHLEDEAAGRSGQW